MIVEPKDFEGWTMSVAQLWGSGPKFSVKCGNCHCGFRERIQMVSDPVVTCPYCGAHNKLNLEIS